VAHLELFPFSGFRLFAEVRGDERTSWEITAVDADGERIPIVLDDLPLGYRQSWRLIPGMAEMDAVDRDEICEAWTTPLREDGVAVDRVEVHRTVTSLRQGGPPPREERLFECGARS
jgi:hypothetical protein